MPGAGTILRARGRAASGPSCLGLPGTLGPCGDLRQEDLPKSPHGGGCCSFFTTQTGTRGCASSTSASLTGLGGGEWGHVGGVFPSLPCHLGRCGVGRNWRAADVWNVLLGLSCPWDRLRLVPVPVLAPETPARVSH